VGYSFCCFTIGFSGDLHYIDPLHDCHMNTYQASNFEYTTSDPGYEYHLHWCSRL